MSKKGKLKAGAAGRRRDIPKARTVVKRFDGRLADGTPVTVLRTTQRDEYEETPPPKKVK